MDTSVDYSSNTLDFLLGDGTKLPIPTDHDLAHLLFSVAKELHAQRILADMIGNHPLDSVSNYLFSRALFSNRQIAELHMQQVRARQAFTAYRRESGEQDTQIRSHFFIACSRKEAYWLLVEDTSPKSDVNKYTILDVDTMASCFADYAHYASPIGLQIMNNLVIRLHEEIITRREKLERMTESFVSLKVTTQRIQSAHTTPRTQGTGIEG